MDHFITDEEELLLVEAIRAQEERTSAEIRVCVTDKLILRAEKYAWKVFEETGMRRTKNRNAALIVMMPRVKRIVMIGDQGLDARMPDGWWRNAVDEMVKRMHTEGPLESIREGLRLLGDQLSRHWPREDGDENELPDELVR